MPPPLSPRAIQARNAFSRSSRRAENCRNGSTLERLKVTAWPASPRSSASPRAAARAKSGRPARSLLGERQHVSLLVGEHVLAERRAEAGKPVADLLQPLLGGGIEPGAGAAEERVVALQHARLLRRSGRGRRAPMQRIDPGEQRLVEVDLVPVAREARRHVALDRLDRVVRVGARQHIEDIADTRLSSRPDRSSAATVLSKSGSARLLAMAAISPRCSASACSNAGAKWSGLIAASGGTPNGAVQPASSGIVLAHVRALLNPI